MRIYTHIESAESLVAKGLYPSATSMALYAAMLKSSLTSSSVLHKEIAMLKSPLLSASNLKSYAMLKNSLISSSVLHKDTAMAKGMTGLSPNMRLHAVDIAPRIRPKKTPLVPEGYWKPYKEYEDTNEVRNEKYHRIRKFWVDIALICGPLNIILRLLGM